MNAPKDLPSWFTANPTAAKTAKRWLRDGYSAPEIVAGLRDDYAYPFQGTTSMLKWIRNGCPTAVHLEADVVEELRAGQRTKDDKRKSDVLIKELERRLVTLETVDAFLSGLGERRVDPIVPRAKATHLPEATWIQAASDWHIEERVRPEMVGGRNEYNPEIAQERAERYFKGNLVMLNAARAAWQIDTVVQWIGGDIITGWIHEENESENFLSPSQATRLALEIWTRGIQFLLDHSNATRIIIPTSSGNHGRVLAKKRINSDFKTSWEFLLYQLLADRFKDEPRIEFQLGYGYRNQLDVYGLRISFHHGDGIKSGGGIGGIAPALYRRIYRENSQRGDHQWDYDVFGHFHQIGFPPRVAQNGSLIGWNAFAEFIGAAPEPPMQLSFVIDAKHRTPVNFQPIFVTKVGK